MTAAAIVLLIGAVDLSGPLSGAPSGPPSGPPTPAARRAVDPNAPNAPNALRRAAAGDPPIDQLRAAATALALAEPARARSMLQRARWSAFLPEVRFRIDRRFGRSESLNVPGVPLDDPPPVGLDTVDEVRYEWRASWDLSRIIFNPDELNAHVEALRMADVRREIESLVIRAYFERRRLKMEALAADGNDMGSNVRRDARIQELEAELDALTGGLFSRAMSGRGDASPSSPVPPPASPPPTSLPPPPWP
jgi:hypothetical protein